MVGTTAKTIIGSSIDLRKGRFTLCGKVGTRRVQRAVSASLPRTILSRVLVTKEPHVGQGCILGVPRHCAVELYRLTHRTLWQSAHWPMGLMIVEILPCSIVLQRYSFFKKDKDGRLCEHTWYPSTVAFEGAIGTATGACGLEYMVTVTQAMLD